MKKELENHIQKYGPIDKLYKEAQVSDLANAIYIERLRLIENMQFYTEEPPCNRYGCNCYKCSRY